MQVSSLKAAFVNAFGAARDAEDPQYEASQVDSDLDEVHEAMWRSIRHLFPRKALASEPKPGWLSITWSMDGDPNATFSFATPILIRIEPDLLDSMWTCPNRDSQRRIARQHEPSVLAGMRGYDPYASLPNARVIVVG